MQKVNSKFLSPILVLLFLSSCVSKKNVLYFQDTAKPVYTNPNGYELKFKKDDLVVINVSSDDLENVKSFNLPIVNYDATTNTATGMAKQQSYLVDAKGEIIFPVLGRIKLEGLTRVQAIDLLTKKLEAYVKNPAVNIQIMNFRINVLGDVLRPGMYVIQNERVTVLDAISLAGDLNISGDRILEVKRDTDEGVITGTMSLKDNDIFSSPFFYLQQNDVVYVRPNNYKIQSAAYNQNTVLYVSVASVLISLISVLIR